MERNLKEVFQDAAQLPERNRANLRDCISKHSTLFPSPDVEAAWSEEIKRRLSEIDAGTVELIPWEEVLVELFGPISTASPSQP